MIKFEKLYDFLIKNNARAQRLLLRGRCIVPIHVSIELNFLCNLRCKMCYHMNELSYKEYLSFEDIKNIFSKLPKNILLSFTGGEVFLNRDIFKILEYTKRIYNFSITTNGVLLTPQTADFLLGLSSKSVFSKGLLQIGISFQGPPDAYEEIVSNKDVCYKVIDNIRYLIQEKKRRGLKYPLVDLRLTVQKENIPYLFDFYRLAKELGVNHCNFAIIDTWKIYDRKHKDYNPLTQKLPPQVEEIDSKNLREELIKIKKEEKLNLSPHVRFTPSGISIDEFINYYENKQDLKKFDCFALWSNIIISPYGDVVLCRDLVLGNILKNNSRLVAIINSREIVSLRKEVVKKGLFPMCKGCCALEQKNQWMTKYNETKCN